MDPDHPDRLPDEEILGQMKHVILLEFCGSNLNISNTFHHSALIFAAMDTTANTISRILYVLAMRPEAQKRLCAELATALQDNRSMQYDEVLALPYMDAVYRETLRLCALSAYSKSTKTQQLH